LKIRNGDRPTSQPQWPLKRLAPVTAPVAAVPHGPTILIPRVGIARGTRSTSSLLTTTLLSSPLLSRCLSACCGLPPPSRFHRHPSRGKGSLSSPLPLAPSWSLSRRSSTLGGRVHRAAFFFRVGRRRPPRFDLLQANQPYHELFFIPFFSPT
jgi:hypothetical protein